MLTKMKIEDWIQRWSTHKCKSCATWGLVVWLEFVNCAFCTNPFYVFSMSVWARWFSWTYIKRKISSAHERMTSSDDDHGLQGQVQDRQSGELHAWSLQMIMWWTREDEYKAKLPALCMGELLEDFTNVLPSTWAKKKHQHQPQVKGSSQRY